MFLKIVKYDLYTGKNALLAASGAMGALLVVVCLLNLLHLSILNGFLVSLGLIATVATVAVCAFTIVINTYNKLCWSESTLTYTTPVSIHHILLSKLLSYFIMAVFATIVVVAFWILYFLLCYNPADRAAMIQSIRSIFSGNAFYHRILMIFPIILLYSLCQLLLCASVANLPRYSNRGFGLVAGIISWIVLGQGSGLVMVGVWAVVTKMSGGSFTNEYLNSPETMVSTFGNLLTIMMIGMSVAAIIYYFIAARILDQKRSL